MRRSALKHVAEAMTIAGKERLLARYVATAQRAISRAFDAQGTEFLKRLERRRAMFESLREGTAEDLGWEQYFTEAELTTLSLFEVPLQALMEAALKAGSRVAIADLAADIAFDLDNPRAVAFLEGRAAARVTMINQTTRAEMRLLLTTAMQDGWSYGKTATAIKQKFDGFAGKMPQQHIRSRAELVAVQEASEAYEQGNLAVGQELQALGLVMEKAWLTVKDDRVSDQCRADEGAGWVSLDNSFPSGNERPPGHVACRCAGLYRRRPSQGKD